MKKYNQILLLIVISIFTSCRSYNYHHSDELSLPWVKAFFQNKDIYKLLNNYYGKDICPLVVLGDERTKVEYYSTVINAKDGNRYIQVKENTDSCTPNIIFFLFKESNDIWYMQSYSTDNSTVSFDNYPLLNFNLTFFFKIKFDQSGLLSTVEYVGFM
jgi:hypothetical protein